MVEVVVVGSGPVGALTAVALSRAGHRVTLVDRDPGPSPDPASAWERRGVMQFLAPHFFRPQVHDVLEALVPDAWAALLAAGAVAGRPAGAPEGVLSLSSRRSTVERTLWTLARAEPGLRFLAGHAERVVVRGGRAVGVVVDGSALDADVVVCSAGRASRFADDVRPPAEGGGCGFAYVSRMYRARPGVPLEPTPSPAGSLYDGYAALAFPQDDRTLSVLLVRAADDRALATLRDVACFDAVVPAVPRLAPFVDPDAFEPITAPVAGSGLTNTYRPQTDDGRPFLPGLVFLGDTVCTTNPQGARGVALGLEQVRALLPHLAAPRPDPVDAAAALDAHCAERVRPWFDEHRLTDAALLRRFAGDDVDVEAPLPSDVICAAGAVDPVTAELAGQFAAMVVLPADLRRGAEERARALLRTGWRPGWAAGPSRADLAELVERALAGRDREPLATSPA